MGLPPVVVGLFVSILLWRNGPFGFLEILYTPIAIVIAQSIIATPIVMGISLAAIQHLRRTSVSRSSPWAQPAARCSGSS
jgi:tungstate transport system permease protein